MIVDVLKVQPGENLTEILETTASDEQVRFLDIIFIGLAFPNNKQAYYLLYLPPPSGV